jgi:uncharacterized protein (TIRG00374 family)
LENHLSALHQALLLNSSDKIGLLLGYVARVLAGALSLHMTLLAFGQAIPLHSTVFCFSLSEVLGGMTTLPGGMVIMETSLVALLATSGVSLAAAMATTLTFRLLALWLPKALGVLAWYSLEHHAPRPFQ